MKLDRIEISGFRGIKRLSLSFDELTTLIGENTWGKSSLLDALCIALPLDLNVYDFCKHDFHQDHSVSLARSRHLQIIIRWTHSYPEEHLSSRYRKFKVVWQPCEEPDKQYIYQRVSSTFVDDKITTNYSFLDCNGDELPLHDPKALIDELVRLHPVIRLKDSRRLKQQEEHVYFDDRVERRINNTCRRLLNSPGQVNSGELRSSLKSVQSLVEHYFGFESHSFVDTKKIHDGLFYGHAQEESSLHNIMSKSRTKQSKLLLLGLLNTYLRAKGSNRISQAARPILIIEDPEGRLHPTQLIQAWNLMQLIPMQKVLTTNSSGLLSILPLYSLRRLVRQSDRTLALSLNNNQLSTDELRRITFHIRLHRPGALFARCWLLVEGETEVWIFTEMARICGYNLAEEGVYIIEFAQSGLKSLIKIASAFNIEWHVVTDGDAAGKKYATSVKSQLGNDQERHRLTELPHKDVEHFLYHAGFEPFFRELVNITVDQPVPPKKIILKALKKHAKPDIALGIVEYCETHGVEMVPLLIRWVVKRVTTMARGNV